MLNSSRKCLLVTLLVSALTTTAEAIDLTVQHRDAAGDPYTQSLSVDVSDMAIVVIDMWDSSPDYVMLGRESAFIPRLNDTLVVARELGIPIVFLPANQTSGCQDLYSTYPQWLAYYSHPYNPLPPDQGLTWPPAPHVNHPQHMYPPGVYPGTLPWPSRQHPDIFISIDDFIGNTDDKQGLWNFCAARGITHLLYTGIAANMCVPTRQAGMMPMRNLGLETIVFRDLTDSMTGNGYDWPAGGTVDYTISPDSGHQDSIAHLETHYDCNPPDNPAIGGSIDASQLLVHAASNKYIYSNRIVGEPGVVSYLRMDGKSEYMQTTDVMRIQGGWNTENVTMAVGGALYGDNDTAAKFDGTAAVIVSPRYQTDLREGSELASMSSGDFTVEAWVQVDALGNRMWALTHDHGDSELDFAVGLNPDGTFRFASRNLANDISTSGTLTVTADDVANNRWFHIVGVQDATNGVFSLFVNGRRMAFKESVDGSGVAVINAITIGCRDGLFDIDDSEPGEGATGAVLSGGVEFWNGIIDEVAIYDLALEGNEIFEHYKIGTTGILVSPLAGDADLDGDVDFADYQTLESRYRVGKRWCDGDFNGDDLVTFADYQMLEQNFGQSLGGSPTPEPATIALMCLGLLGVMATRRRSRPF